MGKSAVSARRAEAYIRQLCCLGISSETLMPTLLGELHALIPSHGNAFYWADENQRLVNGYDENPATRELAPLYLEEFYGQREREVTHSFEQSVRLEHGVVRDTQAITVSPREFYRSDFYNLLLRPVGYGRLLRLILRDSGRARAMLQIQRPVTGPDFTKEHERRLARLEPFLLHALAQRTSAEGQPLVDSGESGMVIADRSGQVIEYSAQARRLLYLATHPEYQPYLRRNLPATELPHAVARLCQRLTAIFSADPHAASAPVAAHRNTWGRFIFRAYWLDSVAEDRRHIAITVTREEPLILRLTRGAWRLPLSRRQAEVAVLLASGRSHEDTAQQLGITRNTVISHSRWIYSKLAVHDREGLRQALLRSAWPRQ